MIKSGVANVIAFYDWDGPFHFSEWIRLAEIVFDECGVTPDQASCGPSPKAEKELPFEQMLNKANQASSAKIKVAGALRTRPGYKQISFGWSVSCSFDVTKGKTAVYCWDDTLWPFSAGKMLEIIATVRDSLARVYGIGYQRDLQKGPDMYAYGMCAGLGYGVDDMREANEIGAWMRERMGARRHLAGALRDVYPVNLLTPRQLDSHVDGARLIDWIRQESWRGTMVTYGDSGADWVVDPSNLSHVRENLRRCGLLILD